ncbi:aminoacyl-tRNA hydrolase [Methylobacterium oryzihabitans]|uniref:Peptidyl-tRNA hydrolase n=1 Tax=Methylobacterium oryzihabitans TaxID=2499852 RepID=A0A3S2V5Y0_9HYPH|nr:aminoacyl-tRNA hydrolase [Methylobacterium oryzihabitans]RVU14401.1 aminoacyl-tRNA hydrolase [Methylobacterium oryzihabitans]
MRLFVGLGNPGSRYAGNRHNIGFLALDALARRHGAAPWRRRFQGEASEAVVGTTRVLLLKPGTYMNESGRAVAEAQRFYKIDLADVVVFHDELDLPPGKLRVKRGGGNAGHNGLRSITAQSGNEYWRVRLGIGHPGDKALVHAYVLNDFAKSETPWVEDLCDAVADHAAVLAKGDDAGFQNKVHLAMAGRGWDEIKRVGERPA